MYIKEVPIVRLYYKITTNIKLHDVLLCEVSDLIKLLWTRLHRQHQCYSFSEAPNSGGGIFSHRFGNFRVTNLISSCKGNLKAGP